MREQEITVSGPVFELLLEAHRKICPNEFDFWKFSDTLEIVLSKWIRENR